MQSKGSAQEKDTTLYIFEQVQTETNVLPRLEKESGLGDGTPSNLDFN